jgi:hypothetical protein
MPTYPQRTFLSLLLITSVAGCGGGSSVANIPAAANTNQPSPASPAPTSAPMSMSCVDGPTYQCSGSSIIRVDNGVALTSSGVQTYGKSTNDLATPIESIKKAFGLTVASGGIAEIRLDKDSNGLVSKAAVLLSNLGISWDAKTDRPQILETFATTPGRVLLDANGALTFSTIPDSADLNYYDYALKGAAATQKNYANNVYFPRATPSRCTADMATCPAVETTGIKYQAGAWRTGGRNPDSTEASRLHEDGDLYAGNGVPDANGNQTILPKGTGFGTAYPGFKGYRSFLNWSFQYGNLAAWVTQDTVHINEWAGGDNEHNKNRRGMVAFGKVSDPATIPTTGLATYSGFAYGWHTRNATEDVSFFRGEATVTVDFATRKVVVTFRDTATYNASATPVPVALTTTTAMGAAGGNAAHYLTGAVDNGSLKGGLSGRYFGPVVTSGTSGTGPAEVGGAFTLSNSTTGETAVGGFIARKQ